MKVLIIEDNKELAVLMKETLEKNGLTADYSLSGEDGEEKAFVNLYDVILLDLNLPDVDGIEVLKTIRKNKIITPVIIISAREAFFQRALGLDSGADDYIVKPFNFTELVARIRAVVRRLYGRSSPEINIGKLKISPNTREVFFDAVFLKLSAKEFDILEYIASRFPDVVSSEDISEHIYDEYSDPFSSVLRVHLANIRKKLNLAGGENILQTIKGKGYFICEKN